MLLLIYSHFKLKSAETLPIKTVIYEIKFLKILDITTYQDFSIRSSRLKTYPHEKLIYY